MVAAARDHGVEGVVLAGMGAAQVCLPPSLIAEATERLRLGAVWSDALEDTLRKVLSAMKGAGIRAVSLKGPLLAHRFYENGVVRPSQDLDVLLDPDALEPAALALVPLGYEREGRDIERFYHEHHHHVRLLHATLPTLELHFHAHRGFGTVLPAASLLARAVSSGVPGWGDALVLSPEDEFLYLAVHAAGHRFQSLMWLFDLKLLALRCRDLQWDVLASRAASHGLSAVVSFTRRLLSDWLGLPALGGGHSFAPIAAGRWLVAKSLIRPHEGYGTNALTTYLFSVLLCDDVAKAAVFSRRWARRGLARASGKARARAT